MIRFRFDRTLSLAAAALVAFAAPASAANTTGSSSQRPAAETSQRNDSAGSERRICVRTQLGGSRLSRRVCKTAQEWETAGGIPAQDR